MKKRITYPRTAEFQIIDRHSFGPDTLKSVRKNEEIDFYPYCAKVCISENVAIIVPCEYGASGQITPGIELISKRDLAKILAHEN